MLNVSELLGTGGPIAARMRELPGGGAYESRPEQTRMAEAVARTLESRGRLMVEAGTGVGKSFAYLVPAILRCIRRGEKVVITTSTIALQEQLFIKDIPLLEETLAEWDKSPTDAPANEAQPPQPVKAPALIPVLAKGRGNYLSIRRLGRASERESMLPDAESIQSLYAIQDWARDTVDGTLSSLPVLQRSEVWDHARSDSDNCMGRKCPSFAKCFYQSARRELEKANLIVCNHALFFADLALRTRHSAAGDAEDVGAAPAASKKPAMQIKAILPNYDHVIFDEAHGLEDAASEHFGFSLSMPRVMRLLRTLYAPGRRRGYLLERSLQLGNVGAVDRAITLVQQAERDCLAFFEDLLHVWRTSGDGSGRVRRPDIVDNPLSPSLRELALVLRTIRDSLEDEQERFELGSFAKRASELGECATAMIQQSLGADESGHSAYAYWIEVEGERRAPGGGGSGNGGAGVGSGGASSSGARLATGDEDEPDDGGPQPRRRGRFGPRVTLACAPIEVAAILRKHLFDPDAPVETVVIDADDEGDADGAHPAPTESPPAAPPTPPKRIGLILTSATLATRVSKSADREAAGGKSDAAFAHAMRNLGADGAATLQLGSPFDYRKQAKVIVDLSVPDPKGRPVGPPLRGGSPFSSFSTRSAPPYAEALADRVLHHLSSTEGGAFVLFTSFATMHTCADRLGVALAKRRWPLLVHGRDGSRQQMLRRFLQEPNAVLFGAASFWQGVDVRGERLRNVIITRLPFEPPDRPLVQARNERIELAGGNPFMQDSLPRAIIRFKQGFGRLIRSKTDRGQVVVLDSRIVTARYGKMFLDALPAGVPVQVIQTQSDEPIDVLEPDF